MKEINIKQCVVDNKQVFFQYYRDNALWYKTEDNNIFPVPIDDIGKGTFLRDDKALLFMRYMRKYNKDIKNERILEGIN